jgi:hypothetical protein
MSRHRKAKRRVKRNTGGWRKLLLLAGAAVAIPLLVVAAFLVLSRPDEPSGPPKAAIVDQLSLTFPNPDFAEAATETLEEAGYAVDYYPGEEVTVDFYRDLPTHGYDLLIFRVHGARRSDVLASKLPDEASLFTSEPYSRTRYVEEQDDLRLVKVRYEDSEEVFFGVRSDFITSSMKGDFGGATVVLMGCDTTRGRATAEAFIQRGAKAVVGWSDLVSAVHTDEATDVLLEHLLVDGLPIQEAVARTMTEVGPDPAFGSELLLYSSEG